MEDVDEPCGRECDDALEHLWEYLDAELAAAQAERIREHLSTCEGCHAEHDVEAMIKRVLRRCCAQEAPDTLVVRIQQQITVLRTSLPAD
ncbi:MAG: mycothiol system anti-sigma-R factor [Actinobacteria bacterium]|nr:mycothiol system anti-sigma-R factor [Actinomycetota bacterium]MCG2800548.1 mycothiol system anti-sigma-R factor [Cellulomonas sp.]